MGKRDNSRMPNSLKRDRRQFKGTMGFYPGMRKQYPKPPRAAWEEIRSKPSSLPASGKQADASDGSNQATGQTQSGRSENGDGGKSTRSTSTGSSGEAGASMTPLTPGEAP